MVDIWYKLDNAANLYPAINGRKREPSYRIDAVLKEEVNPEALQSALEVTLKRFPTFAVKLKKGFFWYYLDPNKSISEVSIEDTNPTSPFSKERDKGYLFKVLYYRRRISLEVFHVITDGFGALTFLKTLLFNYFTVLKGSVSVDNKLELDKYGILYYKDIPEPEEIADAFHYYAEGNSKISLKENSAFKIPGTRIKKNTLKVLHILVKVQDMRRLSKEYDATITEFLTALFIYAILDVKLYSSSEKKPIRISVPLDLRRRFPSKTLRNFSSYINVEYTPEKDIEKINLNDICKVVGRQIREGADTNILRSKFSANVKIEKSMLMRIMPLFLKNLIIKIGFSLYGERITTSTISNLGRVELPERMADMVERFDSVGGAPKENAFNVGVSSFKDTMSISFSSIIEENIVPKKLVDFLVDHGIEVKVEANY